MATDLNSIIGSITSSGQSMLFWIIMAIVIVVLLVVVGGSLFWFYWSKKRWNLRIEFKIPRSDGQIIMGEWGKGLWNAKRGVVYLKRNKMRTVPMKVVNITRYLQGADLMTVIQVGPEDYRPVLNDSWTEHIVEYEDEKSGKVIQQKEAIINIKADTGLNKPWKSAWEQASKTAYSISTFLQQFQTPIAIAIVLIAVFVGISILWVRLPSVCGKIVLTLLK
jgi:hypothetical protein